MILQQLRVCRETEEEIKADEFQGLFLRVRRQLCDSLHNVLPALDSCSEISSYAPTIQRPRKPEHI